MAQRYKDITPRTGLIGCCVLGVLILLTGHAKWGKLVTKYSHSQVLFDLNSIDWPDPSRPNISTSAEVARIGAFDIKSSVGQQRSLEILLEEFRNALAEANLDGHWFIQGGALLGSLRHHDFIPWDDDADIHVDMRYRKAVQAALKKRAPKVLTHSLRKLDKLYFQPFEPNAVITPLTIGSHKLSNYPWGWPSIDIIYYRKIGPVLCQDCERPSRVFNIKDVFPLTYRPLGRQWFPSPRRPISYLKSFFQQTKIICISHWWSHANEKYAKPVEEDCRKLMEKYPFVSRCLIPKSEAVGNWSSLCDEYLVNGNGEVIHKIRLPLDADECDSRFFTVRHESFKCPV